MYMDQRYIRNLNALTEEDCKLLQTKKICVVGCGGLGGYIIELLLRIGVGKITAIDGDIFEESNLNRQLFSDETVLGIKKTEVATIRATKVNSRVKFEGIQTFLTKENSQDLIKGHDVVIDALDNIESRKILANTCDSCGVPMIHGAINGWVAQVTVLMPGSGLIDKLYSESAKIKDKSSLAFTPALCASLQVSEAVKILANKGTTLVGKLLYADMLNMEFEVIDLK